VLEGRIDASSVRDHRTAMLARLDAGRTRFVVDLSTTTFLDSAALAMIVSLLKRTRKAGGDLVVVAPSDPSVQRILHLTRLDRVLDLLPNREAAIERVA
jgi:anti-anti-sigma factor